PRRVLPPRDPAGRAPVAANPDQERGGAMAERVVRETTGNRPARERLTAATSTPRVGLRDATLDDRPITPQVQSDGVESELVEAAEHGQIRGSECSVGHVEVFRRTGSVRTSILGRPRPL